MKVSTWFPRLRALARSWSFGALVAGEVVSLFGSNLTAFVLGVWVFQQTGSASQFALIGFFSMMPEILLAPVAGVLVDRWNRRWVLLFSDAGAALGTVLLLALLWAGQLQVWHIFLVVVVSSVFEAFQGPALQAAIPQLVPKEQLVRANGVFSLSTSGAALLAPLAAGSLLDVIGLRGVLVLDLGTFGVAVAVLLAIRIPNIRRSRKPASGGGAWREEFLQGWRFLRPHRGFLGLMVLFAMSNFYLGMVGVLLTPLVLGFASATSLGTVLSIGAGGFLTGSLIITAWGGPKRKIRAICLFFLAQGAVLFCGGLQPSVPLVAAAAFTFSLFSPMLSACTLAIWQAKVPEDLQGRVYAVRRIVGFSAVPLSYLVAGPLADFVFEPLLAPGGALAPSVGRWIGVGAGRGVGLLFVCLGIAVFAVVLSAYCYGPLRRLEEEIPDAIPDAPEALHEAPQAIREAGGLEGSAP